MNYSYIIIDDNQESFLNTKAVADGFSELTFVGAANNYNEGLNLILENKPELLFLEISPTAEDSNLSLALINELHRFLKVIPKIIITTSSKDKAFEAIQYGITDYLLKPLLRIDLVKLLLKLDKTNAEPVKVEEKIATVENGDHSNKNLCDSSPSKPLILCVKSYGDYRYIDANDICYLQADNNSTDIHLNNGEVVTAFKTLKHFEGMLSMPFTRIHNSYIVNRNYIARIHTGNTVCYIKNSTVKIPFSKSYKSNIDLIISDFCNGNYLEI